MDENLIELLGRELTNSETKRQVLAAKIFHELQNGYYQSSMNFYQTLYQDLMNMSDQAIDIMLSQRGMLDKYE